MLLQRILSEDLQKFVKQESGIPSNRQLTYWHFMVFRIRPCRRGLFLVIWMEKKNWKEKNDVTADFRQPIWFLLCATSGRSTFHIAHRQLTISFTTFFLIIEVCMLASWTSAQSLLLGRHSCGPRRPHVTGYFLFSLTVTSILTAGEYCGPGWPFFPEEIKKFTVPTDLISLVSVTFLWSSCEARKSLPGRCRLLSPYSRTATTVDWLDSWFTLGHAGKQ